LWLNFTTKADLGNPTVNGDNVDTRSNFSIVDTNNPANENGYVTSFQYYASNQNPFEFILVGPDNVVEWISPTITPASTGLQTYIPTTNVPVQTGWNLGAHFDSTGTVPFDFAGAPATYTQNNSGMPTVGSPILSAGTSDRIYSWNATISSEQPIQTYTLTYTTDGNGTINGTATQIGISSGGSGTQVIAVHNDGFHFIGWSDGLQAASRTDTNVIGNINVIANFAADSNNNDNNNGNGGNNGGNGNGNHGHPFVGGGNGGGGGSNGNGKVLGAETFKFTEYMSIKKGSHASEVPQLQQRLTDEGFYTGPISGVFDKATQTAVKAYQSAHPPLRVDGIVGPKTRAVLNQ